jgi:hypothetical protein
LRRSEIVGLDAEHFNAAEACAWCSEKRGGSGSA